MEGLLEGFYQSSNPLELVYLSQSERTWMEESVDSRLEAEDEQVRTYKFLPPNQAEDWADYFMKRFWFIQDHLPEEEIEFYTDPQSDTECVDTLHIPTPKTQLDIILSNITESPKKTELKSGAEPTILPFPHKGQSDQ